MNKLKQIYTGIIILPLLYTQVFSQAFPSEEIAFNNDSIRLVGTFSTPFGEGPFPAILLVSGSGAQQRDGNVLGFKTLEVLAYFFNEQGYATLRYDERATGASNGPLVGQSTSLDLSYDVEAGFNYLRQRKEVQPNQVGMIGHSEGGVIVPMVAARNTGVSFIILAAGFGVQGKYVTEAQQKAILRASGFDEEYITKASEANNEIIDFMIRNGEVSDEELNEFARMKLLETIEFMPEDTRNNIANPEAFAAMQAMQVVAQMRSPWIQFYLRYDPLPTLKKVNCPVLLLYGELDTQVTAEQNMQIMETALKEAGNQDVTAMVIPKANHLFQEAKTGSPAEYGELEKAYSMEFLNAIKDWLTR